MLCLENKHLKVDFSFMSCKGLQLQLVQRFKLLPQSVDYKK